jgi:putative ABC transport system substrate-binding protein
MQFDLLRRREFITLIGAAAAWPIAAGAQQSEKQRLIGIVAGFSEGEMEPLRAQGTPGLNAVREHSRAVPVVFVLVADPVRMGLIESLARPGGHATGFTNFEFTITRKWLELLKELSPSVAGVTFIFNPANPNADSFNRFLETAGR